MSDLLASIAAESAPPQFRARGQLAPEGEAQSAEYPSSAGVAKIGTMGDAGCFSFYPSKNLGAAGDAGLVVCRSEQLATRLRACRNHGMGPRYHHSFIGGNFRLDEIQAAILKAKLPHLEGWATARRAAADFYREEFTRRGLTKQITLPAEPDQSGSGITAPFNAPSQGPPPWNVYRIEPRSATVVLAAEPGGLTRVRF